MFAAQERKPNVVFILVDNVGLSQFGVYGGTIPTPRIDKLASEGIRFNDYNVEVECTPSRSAIMTGRHPVRSGTYTVPFPGTGKAGLAPWEYTVFHAFCLIVQCLGEGADLGVGQTLGWPIGVFALGVVVK